MLWGLFVNSVWRCLCACFMASLPVLVYWCGGVTAPHTGLAYVLQRFGSFPVNPCERRYFWKRRHVSRDLFQNNSVLGEVTYLCGRARDATVNGITVKRGENLRDKDYRLFKWISLSGGLSGSVITASSKSPKRRAVSILLKCNNVFCFHLAATSWAATSRVSSCVAKCLKWKEPKAASLLSAPLSGAGTI